jgi:hypothetical protein
MKMYKPDPDRNLQLALAVVYAFTDDGVAGDFDPPEPAGQRARINASLRALTEAISHMFSEANGFANCITQHHLHGDPQSVAADVIACLQEHAADREFPHCLPEDWRLVTFLPMLMQLSRLSESLEDPER